MELLAISLKSHLLNKREAVKKVIREGDRSITILAFDTS